MYEAKMTAETTPQELFDEIKKSLEGGNFPGRNMSLDNKVNGLCKYRTSDGLRACLIGSFIPNDNYNVRFEGMSPIVALEESGINVPAFLKQSTPLAGSLQSIHDNHSWHPDMNNDFLEKIKRRLSEFGHVVN